MRDNIQTYGDIRRGIDHSDWRDVMTPKVLALLNTPPSRKETLKGTLFSVGATIVILALAYVAMGGSI